MPFRITTNLASRVAVLSTRAIAGHPVSLSAAFFGEWLFSRRTLLFVLLSSACLASSSTPLRVYVFYPNNHFCLASFCGPHSLASVVLSTFHNVPGQSFAFVSIAGVEPAVDSLEGNCLYHLAILRTYFDVLPQLLHILLDTEYNTPTVFCLAGYSTSFHVSGCYSLQRSRCYHAFACGLRLCSYLLTFSIR